MLLLNLPSVLFQSFHLVSKPVGENVPWPLPRTFHPLCALVDPDSVWGEGEGDVKQSIFLLWGRNTKETVAEQAGFFTFDKELKEVSWREVRCSGCYSNLEPDAQMYMGTMIMSVCVCVCVASLC